MDKKIELANLEHQRCALFMQTRFQSNFLGKIDF